MAILRKEFEDLKAIGAGLEQVERARASLEISNASLQRENEFLRNLAQTSMDNERFALRFQANITTQSTYGVKPYPDVPGIPEFQAEPPVAPARAQGFQLAERARQMFLGELNSRRQAGAIDPNLADLLERNIV